MTLFRRIFWVAALGGLLAGLIATAIHQFGTVPLILQAEVYENAAPAAPHQHAEGRAGNDHHHDTDAWEPEGGLERTGYTALADVLTGIGFALLLVCAYVISGREIGWRQGLLWGLAGFAVFTLAPGLGLKPELPGTAAAPLLDRQIWWFITVAATAAGLAMLIFGRRPWLAAIAVALLVVPHLYGAPQPENEHSAAPAMLREQFIQQVFAANLLFWAALGVLTGYFYQRFR